MGQSESQHVLPSEAKESDQKDKDSDKCSTSKEDSEVSSPSLREIMLYL